MKLLYYLVFTGCLITAGCSGKNEDQLSSRFHEQTKKSPEKKFDISNDTLIGGDTFITTGPAGLSDQKQGRIVMIADSGQALPIKLNADNKVMAVGLTDSTTYRVEKEGGNTVLVLPDTNKVLQDGRMMLLTDDGEMLEVEILNNKLVVLTKNNRMLPLEKK